MSGKPAARQGDMTQYGGPIVQGSAGVRIGAPTGVACSVCPGGMTSGNPVNPLLGAKVLPGETDLALPGPLPFILSRTYSSYRTRTPAPVGVFGPGWKAPSDIRLQLRDDALVLNDNGGRSIHFEPLLPGEAVYSRSESMWLVRGGKAAQPDGHTLAWLWGALPPDIRLSPHLYLATNSAQGPWWILGWSERVPGAEDVLPAPLPPYRVLTGLADRFGRTLTYRREAAGDLAGEITGVTDGAGREFRLVLTTQAQRAGWNLYNYPLNPIIRMDPLGLYNLYQLLYDVWHDDSYGTSSIDITGSGDLISLGGHAGLGVAFAKKKGEMLSDICIYATACGHAGIGGGINAAITYSETKSLPTSGVSNSVGVTVGGGVGGHFAYTYVVDVDNPESSTESVGIGAGVDASVMTLACRTWQECWVN
ncbi:hypothetical protein VWS24_004948 [Escherichia coli]|nr:hypothetical protein [Escherichia coli]EJF6564273.1 hypothetical protein [Escherichia coli]EJH1113536.1 hypothetical protein [Escherichia coli]EJI3247575.1 hypothetical protein [Escherichia coli]EKD0112823.1 hypothetical protein [Escherichia coli]